MPFSEYAFFKHVDVRRLKTYNSDTSTLLQYQLALNGQTTTLTLKPNTDVIAPGKLSFHPPSQSLSLFLSVCLFLSLCGVCVLACVRINFDTSFLPSCTPIPFCKGSTLKGKTFLHRELNIEMI